MSLMILTRIMIIVEMSMIIMTTIMILVLMSMIIITMMIMIEVMSIIIMTLIMMIAVMSMIINTLIMMKVVISMIILKISSDVMLKAFLTSTAAGIGQSGHKVTRQGRLYKLSQLLLMITKIRMINIIMILMSCNQGTRLQGKLSQLLLMITP